MKAGIHLASIIEQYNVDFFHYMKLAHDIGYSVVELPLLAPESIDKQKIITWLDENHVELCCGTGLSLETDITSDNEAVRTTGIDYIKSSVDITKSLGANLLAGVLYEPWAEPARAVSDRGFEYMIEALKEAGAYAKRQGVTLALEVLNRYESRYLNTVYQGMDIVDKIGLDNVGLHLDTYHMNIEETNPVQAILDADDYIKHFHVSGNTRCAVGEGHIEWDKIFDVLHKIRYNGYVNVECFVKAGNEVAESVFLWRDLDDQVAMAQKSLEYINKVGAI